MNTAPININARYYLAPTPKKLGDRSGDAQSFDVCDRTRELQFIPAVIFSNASEHECREWVLRNCEEPVEHTKGPWKRRFKGSCTIMGCKGRIIAPWSPDISDSRESDANAALISSSPKLLALLEQYHQSFPSKESGKLICEAKGWMIQE